MKEEIKPTGQSRQIVKTGRALDIEVAERVIGFRRETNGKYRHPNTPFAAYTSIPPHREKDLPRYSESVEAAMGVVEKLFKQGYMVSIHANGVDGFYWCNICTPKPTSRWFESPPAPTPAEAICRAALSAVDSQ